MNKVLKSIFHISVLFLIIISLWPGSLIGFLLYSDWGQQPNLINNPFGTTFNHFISYVCISSLGFWCSLVIAFTNSLGHSGSTKIPHLLSEIGS